MPVFEGTNHCCFQPANGDGDGETFWNKFGTLGRKKKEQEVKEVVAEGNYAIDSPGMPKSAEMPPEVTEILTFDSYKFRGSVREASHPFSDQ